MNSPWTRSGQRDLKLDKRRWCTQRQQTSRCDRQLGSSKSSRDAYGEPFFDAVEVEADEVSDEDDNEAAVDAEATLTSALDEASEDD